LLCALIAFQIESYDEPAYPQSYEAEMAKFNKNAPTRPNSRQSQSSMRAQRSPQESGIIGSTGAVFGPANREHYDPSQWALTVPDANAVEIIPDVDPHERVRARDEPTFMKPLGIGDPLPAFITILGQIPLAQKLMIERGIILADYGKDSTWWSGTSIEMAETTESEKQDLALIHETQRLMAFLLNTTRLYGSVESLSKLKALDEADSLEEVTKNKTQIQNNMDRFVVAWSHAIRLDEESPEATDLFRTVARNVDDEFSLYTMEVSLDSNDAGVSSLYDAIDDLVWAQDRDGSTGQELFLTKLPPILVLFVNNKTNGSDKIGIDIPSEWYLDRYTEEQRESTKQMRQKVAECRVNLFDLANQTRTLETIQIAPGRPLSTSRELFENAMEYLRGNPSGVRRNSLSDIEDEDEDNEDKDIELETHEGKARQLAIDLEAVHENLRKKLEGSFIAKSNMYILLTMFRVRGRQKGSRK
jgi:hypothetical protein